MIDYDDLDEVADMACGGIGLIGALLVVIAMVVVYFVAHDNALECSKRKCREGQTARLLDHECLCVESAR